MVATPIDLKHCLQINLTLAYYLEVKKQTEGQVNEAASLLGKRSAYARLKKWGKAEFERRMREWGKLGGRPKGSGKKRQSKRGGGEK